jgi:DNA-binding CsgD family transcriptional regulator
MDQASISPIALVEAAYDLKASPSEWLPNLLRAGSTTLNLGQGCAAAIWAGTSDEGEPLVSQVHAENGPPDLAMRFASAARQIDPELARATPAAPKPGAHTLAEARCSFPEFHEALTRSIGCKDMLTLWAIDPALHGVGIHIPSATVIELSRQARKRWHMFSVHIASGHRLRRRFVQAPRGMPVTQLPLDGEALLDPKRFAVVEAADHAKNNGSLDEIRRTAIQVDLARGRLRRGETCEALQLCEGVVRGRWSMVDWFDTDGRRFILALPNAPHIRDPRGLTEREYQVATHAGTGDSCKLIAYRLGVSRSRVSELLHRAMRKLGVQTRGQLVIKMRTLLVDTASSM